MLILSRLSMLGVTSMGILAALLAGCSGDGSSSIPVPGSPLTNQVAVIAHTPKSDFNRLTVSVTVCVPGTATCQTISDIMVDTGSVGLRLQSSALPVGFALPVKRLPDGSQLAECELFGGGDAWGMVSQADVQIGGAKAANMPVQVIGSDATRQPTSCPSGSSTSNGTLGIGIADTDCSGNCTMPAYYKDIGQVYRFFSCSDTACTGIKGNIDSALQLPNPTAMLDGGIYNGAVLDLPAVPGDATDQVIGTLTFGVNTASNNKMTSAEVASLDSSGYITTTFNGTSFPSSYIDSGTETYSIATDSFALCNPLKPHGAFCVSSPATSNATITGTDGANHSVDFKIGMYPVSGVSDVAANYGSSTSPNFVWGAPFFFGKRVALVRRTQTAPGITQASPFYAWQTTSLR